MQLVHGLRLDNLRGDLYGGLTAAVVALPLALAFGVASGAGPVAGLYGAIFVGFFAALFGGTPAQISGPTGPMTVVMAAVITQYAGQPALAFTVVLMGGALQILFGVLRLGRYVNLMPYPVISGFMSGIGCIIILLQLPPLIGVAAPAGGPLAVLEALPGILAQPQAHASVLGLLSLAVVFLLPRHWNRILPAPLVALLLGTFLAVTLLPDASRIGHIPTGLPQVQLPTFELPLLADMLKSALVLAVLGSIDSLLTSLVADSITQTYHDSDRELLGQGIGNMIAGLFGAIPGAGATMRSVVNVRAGGLTPLSGMLHALVLLAIVLGLGGLAESIPHAVLAGILLKVGIDIIDWDYLRRAPTAPRAGLVIMAVVLLLTVLVDLITAVAVGVVLASLLLVKRMADLQSAGVRALVEPSEGSGLTREESEALQASGGQVLLFQLKGPLSFASAKSIARQLSSYQRFRVLVLDLSEVPFIDSSTGLAIEGMLDNGRARGQTVLVAGLQPGVTRVLHQLGALRKLPPEARYESRHQALQRALAELRPPPEPG